MNLVTLVDVLDAVLEHNLDAAMSFRKDGVWQKISAKEVYTRVCRTARYLQSWGIAKGERVAIIAENRPEWAIADFATQILGAVDVPIYPTLTAEQTQFILHDSGARVAFVSTEMQARKVQSIQSKTFVEKIVVMDEVASVDGVIPMSAFMGEKHTFARDAELDEIGKSVGADDLATIIYTSGTTGTPKGVMLSHGNITSNIMASTNTFKWSRAQGYISFLPLSHITARHVDYIMLASGLGISYCSSFDDLSGMLREVRPTNFVSVPRVYEKVRKEAERRAASGVKKMIFNWALRVGRSHREETLAGKIPGSPLGWKLADAILFSKIRAGLGGRAECCISGGAPLGRELAEWFADVGIRIFEGYGLTETSPVISINTAEHLRLGSVGRPLPNVECKIANDGELLVRGPSVTTGYWKMPDETRNSFEDGWFKTGDIGMIDPDGFLSITDRKKDLLKTSGGKLIAPQPIENALKTNVLVAQAAVIGDKRKYAAVIIAPNFPLLEDWAHGNLVSFSSRAELISQPKVRQLYEEIISDLNSRLAHFETLKRVILVPDEFTIESGEITPSLKLKRRVVEKKYASLIDALYAETPASNSEPARAH
ncbi:MAG: AMP-dependent synthetase and ligase [Acidobacteriales bacterium]|nr:AMP-dependent synthetase and ligase [Terriglobales bacterium]